MRRKKMMFITSRALELPSDLRVSFKKIRQYLKSYQIDPSKVEITEDPEVEGARLIRLVSSDPDEIHMLHPGWKEELTEILMEGYDIPKDQEKPIHIPPDKN